MIITVTMSSDVTDVWQCDHDITLTLTLSLKRKINQNQNQNQIFNEKISIQALYVWYQGLVWQSYHNCHKIVTKLSQSWSHNYIIIIKEHKKFCKGDVIQCV